MYMGNTCAFWQASMVANAPVVPKLTQQPGCRPLVHSSFAQPSHISWLFNQGLQHVPQTSHPV
jgi:hypothetical protein